MCKSYVENLHNFIEIKEYLNTIATQSVFMDYKTQQNNLLELDQLVKNICGNAKGQE